MAEAGWEPITLARSSDEHVYVERFGSRYLTVFNDSPQQRTVAIRLEGKAPESSRVQPGAAHRPDYPVARRHDHASA